MRLRTCLLCIGICLTSFAWVHASDSGRLSVSPAPPEETDHASAQNQMTASDGDSRCPEKIETLQSLARPIPGFKTFEDSTADHSLTTVTFYDGPPDARSPVEPVNPKSAKPGRNAIWKFRPRSGQAQTTIYQVCHYNETRIVLTNELPHGIKSCQVVYAKPPAQKVSVICQ